MIMQRQVLQSCTDPVPRHRGGASPSVHRQCVLPRCEQRQVPNCSSISWLLFSARAVQRQFSLLVGQFIDKVVGYAVLGVLYGGF